MKYGKLLVLVLREMRLCVLVMLNINLLQTWACKMCEDKPG